MRLSCVLLLLAGGPGLPDGREAGSGEVVRLCVLMRPERVRLPGGRVFSTGNLVVILGARLSRVGVAVGGTSSGAGDGWRLELTPGRLSIAVRLTDPHDELIVFRRIPLRGRSPYDLTHTITLSAIEGMAPLFERLLGGLPRSQVPVIMPPDLEPEAARVAGKTASGAPIPQERPEDFASIGVRMSGAGVSPGTGALWGMGLSAGLWRGALNGGLSLDWWAPLHEAGSDYRLRVQFLTARLGAGAHLGLDPWYLGIEAGPVLRVLWEERQGERIEAGTRFHLSGGLGATAHAAWMFERASGVRLALFADYFHPHYRFTVDGRKLIDAGRFAFGATVSFLFVVP